VLIFVYPNDLKLSALQRLTDPRERELVLRELLPDRADAGRCELRRLRYRPERRYVAALSASDGSTVALLKCYTARGFNRGRRNAQAFRSSGPLRIARLLGSEQRQRMLAFEWIPGRTLADVCAATQPDDTAGAKAVTNALTAAGEALATLHSQNPEGLDRWTREAEAADLLSVGSEIGFISPKLAHRADELARRLAALLAGAPAISLPLHGDFSANQVVIGQQEPAIIDLDWACYGDPADDLGNFIAQTERKALRGELPRHRVESMTDALLAGYQAHRALPDRVGLYTAVEDRKSVV